MLIYAWLTHSFENVAHLYSMIYMLSGCGTYVAQRESEARFETASVMSETSATAPPLTSSDSVSQQGATNDGDTATITGTDNDDDDDDDDDEVAGAHAALGHSDDEDFENTFLVYYVPKLLSTCETSSSLVEALLVAWLAKSILIQVSETNFGLR